MAQTARAVTDGSGNKSLTPTIDSVGLYESREEAFEGVKKAILELSGKIVRQQRLVRHFRYQHKPFSNFQSALFLIAL